MSRSVGVLGGAFNPPHLGHMILAQEAIAALGLDELILVPVGEAPHKPIDPEPGPRVRLELAEVAARGAAAVRVSDVEVEREGPSFSYRTLELLADQLPESRLTFVMGADAAAGLEGWRRPERILELARVGVAARPDADAAAAREAISRLGPDREVEWIEMPQIGISSTMVRERVGAGRPVSWLVPAGVAELIAERGLYGERVSA